MPILLVPWFAVAGAIAAAAIIVVHMLSRRRRTPRPLPTARFVPRAQQRSVALEARPRDLASLLLRATALAAAGLALARPSLPPAAGAPGHVVIADLSGAGPAESVLDTALAIAGNAGVVVVSGDSVFTLRRGDARAEAGLPSQRHSLTGAMVEALRHTAEAGGRLRMSIVSPFTTESVDSATIPVRSLWPGRISLVDVNVRPQPPTRSDVTVRAPSDDPLHATVALLPRAAGEPVIVVVVRDTLTASDSAAARAGQTIVYWPVSSVPRPFRARSPDTVGGLAVEGYTFAAPFPRSATYRAAESGSAERVPLRWIDGVPAAVERPLGSGCIRYVAVNAPAVGDLPISRGFGRIVGALTDPCGGRRSDTPLAPAVRAALAGVGPAEASLPATAARAARTASAMPMRTLLALAILALLLDLLVRRRSV